MRNSIFMLIVFISTTSFSLVDINYEHKKIQKEISKALNTANFSQEEYLLNNSALEHSTINGKFFKIKGDSGLLGFTYVGRVNSCRSGGCSSNQEVKEERAFEYFDYLILFNTSLEIIRVKVFDYQATHGEEITAKSWLKQFEGYRGSKDLIVGKNIDGISGATISTHAITYDVEMKSALLFKSMNDNDSTEIN